MLSAISSPAYFIRMARNTRDITDIMALTDLEEVS
jgi:hypothetical protein